MSGRRVLLLLAWLAASRAHAAGPAYRLAATLDPEAHRVRGVVTIGLPGEWTDSTVRLHLYPNRFRADGPEVNDITRMFVYPDGTFDAGGITITAVTDERGRALSSTTAAATPAAPGTLLAVDRGRATAITLAFETVIPRRYGPFGWSDDVVTLLAGWYPYLAAHDRDGWHAEDPPPAGDVDATIEVPAAYAVALGDAVFDAGHAGTLRYAGRGLRALPLVAFAAPVRRTASAGDTTVTLLSSVPRRAHRAVTGPTPPEILLRAVTAMVNDWSARRGTAAPAPRTLTVVAVPLRWNLTSPTDGLVAVSDRTMHVHPLLTGFHMGQVAKAVYAELLRPGIAVREVEADRHLATDALAWHLAAEHVQAERPTQRDIYAWTRFFDVFAIVDRFEQTPKIPFVQSFFPNATREDELAESVFTYAATRVPPRLAFARLARTTSPEAVRRTFATYLHGTAPLRDVVRAETGATLDTQPPPPRTVPFQTVDLSLSPLGARSRYQLVLDSADVEISSSEVGFSTLLLARQRGDYTKDLAITPFWTDKAIGVHAGPRFHFGAALDPATFEHNLHAFVTHESLNRDFDEARHPDRHMGGHLTGVGARYDFTNVYAYDNPTEQRQLRLFADWFDQGLGSDFSFARYGLRASATQPLGRPTTLGAVEVLAGFEQDTGRGGVPLQERYALGGRRAIRGIAFDERLARNLGLARFEIRQDVYPELDMNLLNVMTFRRPQLRFFVDTGQVDNSAGRALNPQHWAAGAGVGFVGLYDFLGFFPGRAYVEVATRLDRDQGSVQFLLGTRQAF